MGCDDKQLSMARLHRLESACVHEPDMPTALRNVRYWLNSGKHMLALSFSGFDPRRVKTFFFPQKLYATGRDPGRRDRLSIFLLYRVWSQSGHNIGPR